LWLHIYASTKVAANKIREAYRAAVFLKTQSIASRVCENPIADASSSLLTRFKKSHAQQDERF